MKSGGWLIAAIARLCSPAFILGTMASIGIATRRRKKWIRLSHLVRQIAELPGDFRVRLSSIEATEVTRELIDVMADHPDKVAPHLHISMQSGSDSVLRRMRRRWGSRRFIDRCRLAAGAARPAGDHDRHHRRLPRRDGRGVSGDDRNVASRWLFEDSHFSVQRSPRHAGGHDAESNFKASATRTLPRVGRSRI